MVFSVAVGYIKHLAMTRVAWELLCFQPPQTRGSDACCRQPRPPCGCVSQVCRVYGEGECQRDSGATIYGERPSRGVSSLPCGVTCTQGFHPFQRQHIIRASPAAQRTRAQAGSWLPGGCKLWPAAAQHCRSHLTRARRAAPLGGSSSSHSRRRLLSRWDLYGCAGGPWGHRGARQSQASTGTGCWAACCHWVQEMWGTIALSTCASWSSGVPLSDTGRTAVKPQGLLPGLTSRT